MTRYTHCYVSLHHFQKLTVAGVCLFNTRRTHSFFVCSNRASRLSVRVFSIENTVNFLWTPMHTERRTITQPRCELMWRHKRHMININRSFRHSLRLLKNYYCYRRTARAQVQICVLICIQIKFSNNRTAQEQQKQNSKKNYNNT